MGVHWAGTEACSGCALGVHWACTDLEAPAWCPKSHQVLYHVSRTFKPNCLPARVECLQTHNDDDTNLDRCKRLMLTF